MLFQPAYRFPSRLLSNVFCLALGLALAGTASAQTGLMRIEEDWELEIIQPDQQLDAPQVLLSVCPFGVDSNFHFEVDINHASFPAYASGGMQIRAMNDADCVAEKRILDGQRLAVASDTVRWTQIIEKQGEGVAFGVASGNSTSWGAFGDASSYITISNAPSFNYSPQNSLDKSGVTYASNRVKQLSLRRVRYVDEFGQVTEVQIDQSKL
jgi:hypothetical protein